ncbi:hypothetical protein AAG906_003559 [Vitis piasezkii]
MTWILNSIEPHLVLNLRPYKTATTMWNYLYTVYNQDNSARHFQLEYEMANFTQGSHIISACPIRPEMKQGTVYHASTGVSSFTALPAASSVVHIPTLTALANPNTLTPKMVQQMIIFAFSAFGLSGNHTISSKPWYFDSRASNHMTNTVLSLSNVKNYDGNLKINTADGSSLPISVVDQVSRKMIVKGPKVGRLFPLHVSPSTIIPSFPLLSFACNVVGSGHKMWHRRLSHPNSMYLILIFSIFKRFLALIETQFFTSIKVLRYDFGEEYMSNEFQDFLQSKGIISQHYCPSTPQQNGVAERKNRHLLDVVRTLLLDSSVPPRFWCEALSTAIHLINRLPSPMLNHVSPFSKLFGHSLLYFDLCTFGCVCFVHLPTHERYKLTAQSVKCAFLGYVIPHKGYVCYDPHARRIQVSRNVIFFENQYFFPSHVERHLHLRSLRLVFESPTVVEGFKPGFEYERRSQHESNSTSSMPPSNLDPMPDPAPASTTLRRSTRLSRPPDWPWNMSVGIMQSKQNFKHLRRIILGILFLILLQSNLLGQEYGFDYEETFAPVAKMTIVRTILAIMDVKNVFLHGDLQEEIYMKLSSSMTNSSPYDVFLLLVYVDDIIITGTNYSLITKLQQLLHTTFHMKDLGQLTYFLGLEVHHRANGIFVNQHKCIQDLITLAGLEDTSSVDTPMEVSQFITSPRHLHLTAVRRIIHYLRGSPTRGLFFPIGSSLQLVAYSDVDWGGCPDTRRSTTDRVSKSSTEAEYHAMSTACSEIVWLHGLLEELGAIQIATNPVFHERTKHIEVDCHSIRDTLESRVISLPHMSSDLQVANIFTKALTRQRHQFLVGKLLLIIFDSQKLLKRKRMSRKIIFLCLILL